MEGKMAKNYLDVPFEVKSENIKESGIFTGYGSTFGGKPDSHGDVVVKGAFTKTLLEGGRNGTGVAMLYQHDAHKPIGIWKEIVEDSKGLKVTGQLAMKVPLAQDAYELMKIGALKGLSIGYNPIVKEIDEKKKIRYLKEVDLWEISPVTFPANTKARVTVIKAIEDATTTREIEKALREAGLSKSEALLIAKLCRPSLREAEETGGNSGLSTILDSLIMVNENFKKSQIEFTSEILKSLKQVNK